MKDIAQEAIFFDMYYFVKFATDSPRDERPIVNEGTPIFRNMKFENIVCHGAKKGIFVRGLPEMPIQNIAIENATLQAEEGAILIDASGITCKNVALLSEKTEPVISIENSQKVTFENIEVKKGAKRFFTISGERTKNIAVSKTKLEQANQKVEWKDGAVESVLSIMP